MNFQIRGDGGSGSAVTGPDQRGPGGSGVIHVHHDAGSHYLQVTSDGNWTLKVEMTP